MRVVAQYMANCCYIELHGLRLISQATSALHAVSVQKYVVQVGPLAALRDQHHCRQPASHYLLGSGGSAYALELKVLCIQLVRKTNKNH